MTAKVKSFRDGGKCEQEVSAVVIVEIDV